MGSNRKNQRSTVLRTGASRKTQEFRKLLHVVFVDLEKSPLLFVIIIDYIEEVTQWAMLFADNLVLCDPD